MHVKGLLARSHPGRRGIPPGQKNTAFFYLVNSQPREHGNVVKSTILSQADQQQGRYQRVDTLPIEPGTVRRVYLEDVPFPVQFTQVVFTNEDGTTGHLYLVSSDTTAPSDQLKTSYQKRWKVEEYHKSIKQNASLEKSPTRTPTTQTNHLFAALWAFVKLERLKQATAKNHFALKTKLYFQALQSAFGELQRLKQEATPLPLAA